MKHLIKVFAFIMFFSSTLAVAQNTEEVTKEAKEKTEKKVEKVYKTDEDKRVYKSDKKHLATKVSAEERLAALDTDKDGKISIDEASNAENKKYAEYFAKIDTNSDGFIDLTELKAKMNKKEKDKMKSKKDKKKAY